MVTFSPSAPGTPEAAWLGWPALRAAAPLELEGWDTVVIVAPHPDDEVLAAAGLLQRAAGRAMEVTVLAVTDGEASHPGVPDPDVLRRRRRQETEAALRCLGSAVTVHRLGVADGRVEDHEGELVGNLAEQLGPSSLCVAPWHRDGHPDHDAAGRAAGVAARRSGAGLVHYPVWAWHWASPGWGLPVSGLRRLDLTDAEQRAKAAAIDQFHSQLRPLPEAPHDDVVVPPAVLRRFHRSFETFLLVEPVP